MIFWLKTSNFIIKGYFWHRGSIFWPNNVDNVITQKLKNMFFWFFSTKTRFGQKYGKNQHHKTLEGLKISKISKISSRYLLPVPNDSHFKTAQFFWDTLYMFQLVHFSGDAHILAHILAISYFIQVFVMDMVLQL